MFRALATEFESRVISNWELTGASRIKGFDKVIAKLLNDAGPNTAKVKELVLPQLVTLAYETAERDATGLKRKMKSAGHPVHAAPSTPSMPAASVAQTATETKKAKKAKKDKVEEKPASALEDDEKKKKKKKKNKKNKDRSDSSSD